MLFDTSKTYDRSDLAWMLREPGEQPDLPCLTARQWHTTVCDIAFDMAESTPSMGATTYNTGGWQTLPIVLPGQVYLNAELQEYLVTTTTKNGRVRYQGPGFEGMLDAEDFIALFGPVDVEDLETEERVVLECFCPGVPLKTGFISQRSISTPDPDEEDDEEAFA